MKKTTKTISDINGYSSTGKSILFTVALLLALPLITAILLILFKII